MGKHINAAGRAISWDEWRCSGGCLLGVMSQAMTADRLGLQMARWAEHNITLGQIIDAWPDAEKDLVRCAITHFPEWVSL